MKVVLRGVALAFALACATLHANGQLPSQSPETVQAELNRYLDLGKDGTPLPPETGCPILCVHLWEPVCGNNGVTYANDCWAKNAVKCQGEKSLEIAHQGEC